MMNVAGRKVERASFHVGFGLSSNLSCSVDRDKAYMEVTGAGLYIKKADGEFLVPYSNVTWVKLLPESPPKAG